MCTYKYIMKKAMSGVVGATTGMIIGRLNKLAGVATGAAATVATDLGLDWLESKIELTKALRNTEADDGTDDFEFFNNEFDNNEFEVEDDYSDVAEETVTVESVTETMTSEETTIKTSKDDIKEDSSKTEETEKLSPLEEDKKKAKELKLDELDDEKEETPKGAPTNRRLNPTTRK